METTAKKRVQPKSSNRGKDPKELENLRRIAVKLCLKGKLSIKEISKITGLGESTIYYRKWVQKKKGRKWLRGKTRNWGRPRKKSNNLTKKEKEILVSVISQEPRETGKLMLDFWLRTIQYVQHAIKTLFKKEVKRRKARELLVELWFSNQTPLFRAYQQNPEKVEKWLDEKLPMILDEAEKEERTVYYWDEAWFKSTNHKGKTRAKKWQTPIVKATWARFWVNAISIISPRWELRFMVYDWTFTSETLIMFLKRLVRGNEKKMSIILDGHPTHKTKKVKAYLESINHQVKIYILPWYSPELNPDEQVWLHVHNDLKGQIIANKKQQIDKVRQSLYRQQKQKSKVASYFRHLDMQRKSD